MIRNYASILGQTREETTISKSFGAYNRGIVEALEGYHRDQNWNGVGALATDIEAGAISYTTNMIEGTGLTSLPPTFEDYNTGLVLSLRRCQQAQDWGALTTLTSQLKHPDAAFCLELAAIGAAGHTVGAGSSRT